MLRKNDPYCDKVIYHKAAYWFPDGSVSALCYKRPRKINLDRGYSWTIIPEYVTCPKCRKILKRKLDKIR